MFTLLGRAVLRETQLPVGGGSRHDLPIFVLEGSVVVMPYYVLHLNTEVFGNDVETFRPERWNSIKPDHWEFLGFDKGNRAGPGQQNATIEESCVLPRLAREIERPKRRDGAE